MLAAGRSQRMLDDKGNWHWKLTLPYPNQLRHDLRDCERAVAFLQVLPQPYTILDASIARALQVCEHIVLVTGSPCQQDFLQKRYATCGAIQLCNNPNFQQGMFSSIQCGVAQLKPERFFICLGDMPNIASGVYHALNQASGEVIFPGQGEYAGHPVSLPAVAINHILNAPINGKMKACLAPFSFTFLKMDNALGFIQDIDHWQAHKALFQPARLG